jgi:hypothetical protein
MQSDDFNLLCKHKVTGSLLYQNKNNTPFVIYASRLATANEFDIHPYQLAFKPPINRST